MGRTQKKVICEVICWSIREREGVWIGGLEHDFTFFGAKNAGGGRGWTCHTCQCFSMFLSSDIVSSSGCHAGVQAQGGKAMYSMRHPERQGVKGSCMIFFLVTVSFFPLPF